MTTKIFSLLLSFTLLFSACSSKKTYKDTSTSIYSFLKDKNETLYIFFDDKYSYLINDEKNVKKLKDIFKISKLAKKWDVHSTSYLPHITLEENNNARVVIPLRVYSPNQKLKKTIKKMGFRAYPHNKNIYGKSFILNVKYAFANKELRNKYIQDHFKSPIKFHRTDNDIYTTKYQSHGKEALLGAGGGILFLGIALPLMLTVGIVGGPNSFK